MCYNLRMFWSPLSYGAEKKLKQQANFLRQEITKMLANAKSGHLAGALGMADIFAALYFGKILRYQVEIPNWSERDYLILSNGHICPVLYASLAMSGFFDLELLKTLRQFNSPLQGHPHRGELPGVETTSGPLGEGLSQAIGMALADRIDQKNNSKDTRYFYCLLGDGELDEGQNWEALMLANKYHLNNLIAIVDRNKIQIDGWTEGVLPLEPLKNKLEAFGWQVQEIDGHNFKQIFSAVEKAKKSRSRPSIIIANTIPGKGVKEFENKPEWHGRAPDAETAQRALRELQISYDKI